MTAPSPEDLPVPQRLALAYSPVAIRDHLHAMLGLDQRLARIVAQASEPMLAQLRLAWWRDELGKSPQDRPQGDAVLDAIAVHWQGDEGVLVALVDGWEQVLAEPPMPEAAMEGFAQGRSAAFLAHARAAGVDALQPVEQAARRWAYVDLAAGVSDAAEREALLYRARSVADGRIVLPRSLRPLAILDGLARRALATGERELLASRGASLAALRLGILGR
jgi:phytoene synthase